MALNLPSVLERALTLAEYEQNLAEFLQQSETSQPDAPLADALWGYKIGAVDSVAISPANGVEISGTDLQLTANQRTGLIAYVIDGGGATITTGLKGFLPIPQACTITAARLLGDTTGSIVVDIWKADFDNYPPTDSDSITGSAEPEIETAAKSEDTALSGWTTSIAAGDVLAFNVDSVSSFQRVTVALVVEID